MTPSRQKKLVKYESKGTIIIISPGFNKKGMDVRSYLKSGHPMKATDWNFYQQKTANVAISDDSGRECWLAAQSKIPANYVPPPQNLSKLMTVPYKWPDDEDWSRSPSNFTQAAFRYQGVPVPPITPLFVPGSDFYSRNV